MAHFPFVLQTGTKQDDREARKLIRRQVMLGKNQGRTQTPKQPSVDTARNLTKRDMQAQIRRSESLIPRRVGSDLSFLNFADTVDPLLVADTLQFCSATSKNLFVLEPCIAFDPRETVDACFRRLADDALYLHVMVFGTQVYMNTLQATTNWLAHSRCGSGAQHYGKALRLLRQRLVDAERLLPATADATIMAVMPLVMHALITADLETARNHVVGLSKIVKMRYGGISAFSTQTKQMIELLRCDICVALATGHEPLFFTGSTQEPTRSLIALPAQPNAPPTCIANAISNHKLNRIWKTLACFCRLINKAASDAEPLSEKVLLDTMAPAMYGLLSLSVSSDPADEAIRMGMLSFCSSVFLQWRQLHIPFDWLQNQSKRAIARVAESCPKYLSSRLMLWLLVTHYIAFSTHSVDGSNGLRLKIEVVVNSLGLTTFQSVKTCLSSFLWVDIVCDSKAQEFCEQTFAERTNSP